MKIGIVTLNGYFNYGNRLQNYALQKVLEDLGHEVETIRFDKSLKKRSIFYKFVRAIFQKIKFIIKDSDQVRQMEFKKFSNLYINETRKEFSILDDLSILNDKYDKIIIGSDQVWNPKMNSFSSKYFGQFVDRNKRISYAASFGVSKIEKKYEREYQKWLLQIPCISVREEDGAKIVKKLTRKNVPVLSDPTVLLDKEEWLEISKQAQFKPKKKYILTYFLGGLRGEVKENVENLANEKGLEIVNLGDKNEKNTYETGPREFIDYINDAEVFFTDSFHGVVFSIILETPFVVYERVSEGESMYSRIITILETFDLNDREACNENINLFNLDFTKSKQILAQEKGKSLKYLNFNLNNQNIEEVQFEQ